MKEDLHEVSKLLAWIDTLDAAYAATINTIRFYIAEPGPPAMHRMLDKVAEEQGIWAERPGSAISYFMEKAEEIRREKKEGEEIEHEDMIAPFGTVLRHNPRDDASTAYSAIAVNYNPGDSVEFGEPTDYDLLISFVRRSDKKWLVNLYTYRDNVDCGDIAKQYGGSGNKRIASFVCEHLPFPI